MTETTRRGDGTHPSPPNLAVRELLRDARRRLADASTEQDPADRYIGAHLAALRGAATVLAARAQPVARTRQRPRSAWELLSDREPRFAEWASYFAASARRRAAAEAGIPHAVSARDADDLIWNVDVFLTLVAASVGLTVRGGAGQRALAYGYVDRAS